MRERSRIAIFSIPIPIAIPIAIPIPIAIAFMLAAPVAAADSNGGARNPKSEAVWDYQEEVARRPVSHGVARRSRHHARHYIRHTRHHARHDMRHYALHYTRHDMRHHARHAPGVLWGQPVHRWQRGHGRGLRHHDPFHRRHHDRRGGDRVDASLHPLVFGLALGGLLAHEEVHRPGRSDAGVGRDRRLERRGGRDRDRPRGRREHRQRGERGRRR